MARRNTDRWIVNASAAIATVALVVAVMTQCGGKSGGIYIDSQSTDSERPKTENMDSLMDVNRRLRDSLNDARNKLNKCQQIKKKPVQQKPVQKKPVQKKTVQQKPVQKVVQEKPTVIQIQNNNSDENVIVVGNNNNVTVNKSAVADTVRQTQKAQGYVRIKRIYHVR